MGLNGKLWEMQIFIGILLYGVNFFFIFLVSFLVLV